MKITHWIRICLFLFLPVFCAEINAEPIIGQEIVSPRDSYHLIKQLGEGAFGRVFSAKDSSEKLVAIKWYMNAFENTDYTYTTDSFWQRLGDVQREYENGQLLNHPNIVRSIDLFSTEEKEYYLVLEFILGKTVHEITRKEISLPESLKLAFELVHALHYAESIGLFHMDLHTGNWMMSENKETKLIDLASFFSWEEIEYFESSYDDSTENYSPVLRQLPNPMQPAPRLKKLQRFFMKHPQLQRKKLHLRQIDNKTAPEYKKNLILAVYFDNIAGICFDILEKSRGSKNKREQKIQAIEDLLIPIWDENEVTKQALMNFDFRQKMQELQDLLLS